VMNYGNREMKTEASKMCVGVVAAVEILCGDDWMSQFVHARCDCHFTQSPKAIDVRSITRPPHKASRIRTKY